MAKKYLKNSGYTITELMIVLAISGAMVMMAYTSINGQKNNNEFTQAVRNFENRLTDIANDVVKGYFPNTGGNQQCDVSDAGIDFSAGPVQQGGSRDCIFAGKALNFTEGSSTISLQTLASRRVQRSGDEIYSLDDLEQDDIKPAVWMDEEVELTHGLQIDNVKYGSPVATDVASVAFMSSFASRTKEGSGNLSGSTTADVKWISTAPLSGLDNPSSYQEVTDADGIKICVIHDGGDKALVHVGQNGSLLSTYTEFNVAC